MMSLVRDVVSYWRVLWMYLGGGAAYAGAKPFVELGYEASEALRMGVHVFSLALAIKLWSEPHYRKSSYAADVRDNFRNVAVPGTGIPLSALAYNKWATICFLVIAYPVVCLCAALGDSYRTRRALESAFREQLLAPRDWFSLWRINSRLAAWHSLTTRARGDETQAATEGWHDYSMENKWLFLQKGLKLGVAVSPVMETPARLCVKHRNEEGGMGIHFFDNALDGGDWIIQEVLYNDDDIAALLPDNAPLSTFRVMTGSNLQRLQGCKSDVFPLSCVFRAGRQNAATDHSSILFDVDIATGTIGRGTTNAQWYKLGQIAGVPWGPPAPVAAHPDTGRPVSGAVIKDFKKRVLDLAVEAHTKMLPRVPIAGWDVVLSKNHGSCLLEVNLSCNFFRGSFNESDYYNFVDRYFAFCQDKSDANTKPLDLHHNSKKRL